MGVQTTTANAQKGNAACNLTAAPGLVLQRQCACGQHTLGGAECDGCKREKAELPRQGTGGLQATRAGALDQRSDPFLESLASTLNYESAGMPTRAAKPQSRNFLSELQSLKKREAAYDSPSPQDDEHKVEGETGRDALIGLGVGASVGAIAGGILGGGLGALVGAGVGGLLGAGIGAVVGALSGGGIKWGSANYSAVAAGGASTTVERPFNVTYKAVVDKAKNAWRLAVDSIEGGVDITVHTGGSRDPLVHPPTTQAEAADAVTVMKGYYARGSRGSWHTEAASRAHEEHHYREWQCSSEHYWPAAKASIESLTASVAANANEAAAIAAMRGGAAGADAKVNSFRAAAHQYWFTLSDSAGARPYAAGQSVLNEAVRHVQDLAAGNHWNVPQGTDNPSPEPPCYQPWTSP